MHNDKSILCDIHQIGIGNAEKVKRAPNEPEVRAVDVLELEGRARFFLYPSALAPHTKRLDAAASTLPRLRQ
jgi:hypothetical protein